MDFREEFQAEPRNQNRFYTESVPIKQYQRFAGFWGVFLRILERAGSVICTMYNYSSSRINIHVMSCSYFSIAFSPITHAIHLGDNTLLLRQLYLREFGGSCNMLKAAVDTNRFSIVYEYCKEFILKAVQRFELFTVCEAVDQSVSEAELNTETVRYELETIPYEATIAQIEYLKKIANARPDLLLDEQKEIIFSSESTLTLSFEINNIYKVVNKKGFQTYRLPSFDNGIQMDLVQIAMLQNVYSQIESIFSERYPNKWLQSQYEHYKMEPIP